MDHREFHDDATSTDDWIEVPDWRRKLQTATKDYDDAAGPYDEVFLEVAQRLNENQYATKSDIAVVGCWKRSVQGRWIGQLLALPEKNIRDATGQAFQAKTDIAALRALAALPGFKTQGPIATVLLYAYDQDAFAVMDRRAWLGLHRLGAAPERGRGETVRYLERVRQMRDGLRSEVPSVTARDVDKGLYILGKP